jgi:hypothetical protein
MISFNVAPTYLQSKHALEEMCHSGKMYGGVTH